MIKILKYADIANSDVFIRTISKTAVEKTVADIIADVRENGDAALMGYTKKFDKAELTSVEVTPEEMQEALKEADPKLVEILEKAAKNIEAFHRHQLRDGFVIKGEDGIVLGQRVLPLDRVGVYVPGGTACYPSTVLMNCIPAKLAGVREIVLTTPPSSDGTISPDILAAAKIGGADRIIKAGGAQAVAALAYGTETVPRVDKIVGPGNAYVAEAKKQVFGQVAIDMIAGPSEILVIADDTANAEFVAADMLSQAEHDAMASAVLVTTSADFAEKVAVEIDRQVKALPRCDIACKSLDDNGKIILADSLEQAVEISNALAPEHLELCVEKPFETLEKVKNAGSVFLGNFCPEALGDYFAGPNHTLPTLGTARFSSPLSVDDFIKKTAFTYYTPEALARIGGDITYFAEKEGLGAHARSVAVRLEQENKKNQ